MQGAIVRSGAAYGMAAIDDFVIVNKGVGSPTLVTLPTQPPLWMVYTIKDGKGDAAANPITVQSLIGLIDGSPSATISTNYGAISVTWDTVNWVALGVSAAAPGGGGAAGPAGPAGPPGATGATGPAGPTGPAASTTFVRTVYTASGAISPTDTLSILNGASGTMVMTLTNGTVDGQRLLIKLLGAANATVTANIDGSSGNAVTLSASSGGTLKDGLRLNWSVADTTWIAE